MLMLRMLFRVLVVLRPKRCVTGSSGESGREDAARDHARGRGKGRCQGQVMVIHNTNGTRSWM